MTALIAALTRDPRRRWWQVGAAAIVVAAIAVTGVAVARSSADPAACRAGDDRVARVWGPERRAALAKAFDASGRPHAAATFGKLTALLDDWSARWQGGYVDACEATHVRAEQSEHLLDLRMQCLTRRLDDAGATIDLLAAGGGDAVDHALDAVRALPPLDACADPVALTASVAPPADAATSARVAAVRAKLDDARGLDRLGRYAPALAAAKPALAAARTTGYPPVVAEALLVTGRVEASLVDHAAFADLREATRIAIESGDDATMIAASTVLVGLLTRHSGQFDVARELVELADATARRIQLHGAPRIELDNAYSGLDLKQGRNADAQARYTATLAVAERDLGSGDRHVFATLDGLGFVANALGHFDEAVKLDERVLAMTEQVFGKDHPDVANALNNLGIAYRNADRLDDAKRAFDRALALRIAALGPDHPEVGDSLNSLGTFYLDQGDAGSAAPYFERALVLWQKAYGDDNVETAPGYANLAIVAQSRGDLVKARTLFERTLVIDEAAYGSDDPRVASVVSNLGGVATDQKHYDEALALYLRAEHIAEAAYGPDHPDVADYLANIATAYKRLGKMDEAVAAHQRAVRAMEKAYGPDHTRVAMALSNLGNLQSDREDYAGALVSYQKSLAIFEAKLKKDHPYVSYALLGIGGAMIELKRKREAVPILERALAIRVAAQMGPELVAEARYALARALDRGPKAVAAATTALAEYKQAADAESAATVKQWLASHR